MLVREVPGCSGCPFYGTGTQGFVPDELVPGTAVLAYAQNPGWQEEVEGVPMVGAAGKSLEKQFLPLAGLQRGGLSLGNALRCRVNGSDELPPLGESRTRQAINHCTQAHHRLPEGTRLVIAQGAYALWALTGEGLGRNRSITGWRGYALPYQPAPRPTQDPLGGIWTPPRGAVIVLPTLHPAALMRDMSLYPAAQHDWAKVPQVLQGYWPQPLPPVLTEPPPSRWPDRFAFDSEYDRETRELHMFSVADDTHCWVIEGHRLASPDTPTFAKAKQIVTQNAMADWPYIRKRGGYWSHIDDTMLAHAALWSDLPHDLDFLGSIYGLTNRWKHLAERAPLVYAGADAWNTWFIWQHLQAALAKHPGDQATYNTLHDCWPIIQRAQDTGQRVSKARALAVARALRIRTEQARLRGAAACGWPINLGSPDQVRRELYDVEGL